jgi:hypothetical protein
VRSVTVQNVYEAAACRIYLMGRQNGPREVRRNKNALEDDVKAAVLYFQTVCLDENGRAFPITEPDLMRRLIGKTHFMVGSRDETELCEAFRGLLSSTGQWAACDEKVFEHDTARSGLIRVVPAKKQVGLWNYSTCVRLEGAQPGPLFYPYLVYSRCHTELVSLDQHVTTFDIISAQVDFLRPLQQGRRFETILVYDSYYGTLLSLQYFREQRIPAIMCLNIQRFREYEALLDRFVQKTGEMAFAERAKDNPGDLDELITLFSSPDHRKGRRYTWTNALRRQNERKAPASVPGFDHYEAAFNVCDVFNRQLHDKSWPYRYSGKAITSEYQAGSDYLFTVAVVNMWNYWRSLDVEHRHTMTYEQFCTDLAVAVMGRDYLHLESVESDE